MGCVESSEELSTQANEEAALQRKATGAPPKEKKRSRSKSKRSPGSQKQFELDPQKDHISNTKIRVIWRRVSVFNSRRNSTNVEDEAAGPSQNGPESLQP